ncbi:hypothetical protein [Parafrigoribacterium soli]|uniref:hypothetical protein n=1 Tax=Parafrigoribacterium soli TaxID=3144663 RepID=UPI0032EAD848
MAEPTFDPRFDPAFQRGYEPSLHAQKAPRSRPRVDPIGEPPASPEVVQAEEPSVEIPLAEPPQLRRGINPYVVVLWVIGVVFTLGGPALSFSAYFFMVGGFSAGLVQSQGLQLLFAYGSAIGIPMFTVGLATIAGVIFFSAWRSWQRRNRPAS